MKKTTILNLLFALALVAVLVPMGVSAATTSIIPNPGIGPDTVDVNTPRHLVENAWSWFIVIAAAICIIVIIWAGITYATAGGDEEKVKTAKSRLIYGIIGVAVIIAAYAITAFITQTLSGGGNIPAPTF